MAPVALLPKRVENEIPGISKKPHKELGELDWHACGMHGNFILAAEELILVSTRRVRSFQHISYEGASSP